MALSAGTRLGPYEIASALGAGGMGEVYRATDLKLKRQVAVKIVPPSLAGDSDRLARFRREAEVLASLNHPNIATVYGLEEAEGMTALVLELVEGDDLAERLGRPIPVRDVLPIAKQIAEALEVAHGQGIIHRDLKPGNIRVRRDGTVKVLDFGLAKLLAPRPSGHLGDVDPTLSPTISDLAPMTVAGMMLGTPAYMSPEQARGEAVDERADIWAFGCVLFEMLSGRRPFEGTTITDTVARVLEREPEWARLPAETPPAIVMLLRRCLRKDRRKRLHDIVDARIELEDSIEATTGIVLAPDVPLSGRRRRQGLGVVAVAVVATVAGAAMWNLRPRQPDAPERVELPIYPAENSRFVGTSPQFAISPDGRHVAFVGSAKAGRALWVRSIDAIEPRVLAGTEGAQHPFWSADSQFLGFFADGKLKTIRLDGGTPVVVCAVPPTGEPVGPAGTWRGDVIVFGPSASSMGLSQVAAKGGTPKPVTTLTHTDTAHRWPWFLPDGQHFLFLAQGRSTDDVRVGSLASSDTVTVGPFESHVAFAADHLFFVRGGNLMAQRFEAATLQLTGPPLQLNAHTGVDPPWQRGTFSVSQMGRLVFRGTARTSAQLTWLDRRGNPLGRVGDPLVIFNLDLTPDDQQVAVSMLTQKPNEKAEIDLWQIDVADGRATRLTDDPGWEFNPVWSPDRSSVAFNSNRSNSGAGPYGIFVRRSNGTGEDAPLVKVSAGVSAGAPDWSRTDVLLYTNESGTETGSDLWTLSMAGSRTPEVFLKTRYYEGAGAFSPDGQWIAYHSDSSGRFEVYVRPFPARDPFYKISTDGGAHPRWSGDGQELFWLSPDGALMAARFDATTRRKGVDPQLLFPTQLAWGNNRPFDVSRDGQRVLVPIAPAEPLRVVLDWRAMLPR